MLLFLRKKSAAAAVSHPTFGVQVLSVLLLCLTASVPSESLNAAEVVYQTGFEGAQALQGWSALPEGVRLAEGRGGSQGVLVERPAVKGPGAVMIRRALPLERVRGARLRFETAVRAENVRKPPNVWNGIKFTLHTVAPGGERWEQQNDLFGTFDWKVARFITTVPRDATEATLILGLENTTGQARFDDVKVSRLSSLRTRPAPATNSGPVFKGHNLPRLRGVMVGRVGEADLRVLGREWKANHVRWQLIWGGFPRSPADGGDLAAYDNWLESELQRLDKLLPVCEQVGIKVLIDIHTPPGGRDGANVCQIFQVKKYQEEFLAVWEKIAKRYRGVPTVWGYDLVNEPVEGLVPEDLMDWQALALQTARLVRAIDADHAIIIEPAPWGGPEALESLEPLPVPGVVYSVHMYQPHRFTHQGVYDNPSGITYPGRIAGRSWDKAELRRALQPAIDFQHDHNVHIYVGEFSAIRWAPGESARDCLRDVIDILEENGWDWAYHAFREWDGWSVEHGADPKDHQRSQTPTEREKLLRSWFGRNSRPH